MRLSVLALDYQRVLVCTGKIVVWVLEEPATMGALTYVLPRLRRAIAHRRVRSMKRSASASPATGSAKTYELE